MSAERPEALPTAASDVSPPAAAQTGEGEESFAEAAADQLVRLKAIAAAIDEQIAAVRARQLLPQTPDEARDLARTLDQLIDGCGRIHDLLNANPQRVRHDDRSGNFNSADLDARRDALAYRIESLVAEWLHADNAGGAE